MEEKKTIIRNIQVNSLQSQELSLIDTQIATAKNYPRNLAKIKDEVVALISTDEEIAKSCVYSVPRGGTTITGPSVHLARILAQIYGNLRVEAKIIDISPTHITSQATAYDLENNLAIRIEIRKSIMTRNGRMSEDMITITGNAANAIALRNAILSVIPRSIVDAAYKAAQATITGDLTDEQKLIKKRKMIIDGFVKNYGVSEQDILKVIGKPTIEAINQDDIVTLIGIAQAIKDGDTTIEEAFKKQKIAKNENKNEENDLTREEQRILEFINKAKTRQELIESCQEAIRQLPKTSKAYISYLDKLNSLK